jgi:hypothetical protein
LFCGIQAVWGNLNFEEFQNTTVGRALRSANPQTAMMKGIALAGSATAAALPLPVAVTLL